MNWNPAAGHILGVDLGGTNVRAAVLDRNGRSLGSGRAPSHALEGVDRTVAQIAGAVDSAISASGIDRSDIAGLGFGVTGHIDTS